jgi:hypothetical protein
MAEKKLPFSIKPAGQTLVEIGDDQCGTVKLPRYDDITPNEKMFIDESIKELPDSEALLIKLVNTIAEKRDTPVEEVWEQVRNNDAIQLMKGDMEGLMHLRKVQSDNASIKRLIYATAMIIYRCPDCSEWTMQDVSNPKLVPPKLLRYLEEFCLTEMNRGQTPLSEINQENSVDETELKKIVAEPVTTKAA